MKLGSGSELRDGGSYRGVTLLWVWPTQCDDSTVTIFMETLYTLHSTATENIPRGFIIYLLAMMDEGWIFWRAYIVCSTHLIVWWEMKSTWLQSQWVPGTLTQPGPWRQMMGNRSLWYSLHCDNNGKHILTFYNQDHWEFNLLNSNLKVINFILIHQHLKPHMNYYEDYPIFKQTGPFNCMANCSHYTLH